MKMVLTYAAIALVTIAIVNRTPLIAVKKQG